MIHSENALKAILAFLLTNPHQTVRIFKRNLPVRFDIKKWADKYGVEVTTSDASYALTLKPKKETKL